MIALQALDLGIDARHRGGVRAGWVGAAARVRHHLQGVRQVVEHADHVAEHEDGVRQIEIVARAGRHLFEPAHRVVSEVADRAAAKARQPRQRHRLMLAEQTGQLRHRVPGERSHVPVLQQLAAIPAGGEDHRGPTAEQREATPLLSALDALQKERIGPAVHLEEGRHRRVHVGEDLAIDGHQPAAAGQRLELGRVGTIIGPKSGRALSPSSSRPAAAWFQDAVAGRHACRSRTIFTPGV